MNIDFSKIPADLIMNLLNIVILFLVVRLLFYKPIKGYIDGRKAKVNSSLAEAEAKNKEAEMLRAEYTGKLADAENEAKRIVADAAEKASAEAKERVSEAQNEAGRIIADAREKAKAEREDILSGMQTEITESAVMIAEKILEREVNDSDTQRIADEFFDQAKRS